MTGSSRLYMAIGMGVVAAAIVIGGAFGGEASTPPEPMRLEEPTDAPEEPGQPEIVPSLPVVPRLPEGTHLSRAHGESAEADEQGDDLSAEMRLVSEARRVILEDPTAALALLDQHRERYPAGALSEERDAYTILSLDALGRTTDVERRYVDFREDYPTSTFLPVLQRALETP